MPVDNNRKFIFVHIPKVSGTSIELALDLMHEDKFFKMESIYQIDGIMFAPQHLRSKDLKNKFLKKSEFDSYFKFSFVRNPYDRVISEYLYNKNIENFDINNFRKWLYEYYEKIDYDHKLLQYEFLYEGDKLLVDFVGRFENLKEDFSYVCKKININVELPHLQKKQSKSNIDLLEKKDLDFIYDIHKKDFEIFNYKKI
jgi:hypothetical protein